MVGILDRYGKKGSQRERGQEYRGEMCCIVRVFGKLWCRRYAKYMYSSAVYL